MVHKLTLAAAVLVLVALYFLLDLQTYFSLEYFQAQREALEGWYREHPWQSRALYFLLYVVVAALSLPAAAIITLAGGALFGFWWGLLLVSFASSIGATLAFLISRTVLRDWVQRRFAAQLGPINRGMERDGAFYLFTLRLVPVFPFFIINLVMGIMPISTATFYVVSQLGMLFGTAVYVNVGAQLGQVTALPQVFNAEVLGAIALLALFPWVARAALSGYRNRRVLSRFSKPASFETNMVVIGAGAAGLVTAYIAALVKAKVMLIEKHRMGGDCLNTGCVPSKALLRSAHVSKLLRRADEFGLQAAGAATDFPAVMRRIRKIIQQIEPHDSVERYEGLGVDCVCGEARIVSPWCVEVDGRRITTRSIVLATGARPAVPDIPGLEQVDYLTSESVWSLEKLPARLLVLGAGPVGCELAQAFARLGAGVTLVNKKDRLLPREDTDVSAVLQESFNADGIEVLHEREVKKFEREGGRQRAILNDEAGTAIDFDAVLLALGRKANTEGLGLEDLGVRLKKNGTVEVNEHLRTACPTIHACGDVAGPYQFTHMASFQAWFASINSLFGFMKKFRVHYRIVPQATFTDPEVARVGLNETEARRKGIEYEATTYGIDDLDRAIADSEAHGFIKVLTRPGKDAILGVTIVGYHAAELLAEYTLAMTHGIGLKKILGTIHVYPSLSESNKYVAGRWRSRHAPEWLYPWLARLHSWRRH